MSPSFPAERGIKFHILKPLTACVVPHLVHYAWFHILRRSYNDGKHLGGDIEAFPTPNQENNVATHIWIWWCLRKPSVKVFLLDYWVISYIITHNGIYGPLPFCGITCDVSLFYLSLFSFYLISLCMGLLILFIFSKNQFLVSLTFLLFFYFVFNLFLL